MKWFKSTLLILCTFFIGINLWSQVKLFYGNGYDYASDYNGTIYSCLSDGTEETVCFDGINQLYDLDMDYSVSPQKVYYIERGNNRIRSAHIDGTNQLDVITDVIGLSSLTLDPINRKIYYTVDTGNDDSVYKADMDGTDQSIERLTNFYSLTNTYETMRSITIYHDKVYWIRSNNINYDYIFRCNTDGTNREIFVSTITPGISMSNPYEMAIGKDYVFWTDPGLNADFTYRISIDQTNPAQIISNREVGEIAIDTVESKLYWTELLSASSSKIVQTNLDGSNEIDVLITNISFPVGLRAYSEGTVSLLEHTQAIETRCYPNPINASTRIEYAVTSPALVKIAVYNMAGKQEALLVDTWQSTGQYTIYPNIENKPSGIYLCHIRIGSQEKLIKLVNL
jgi:hypothetical protein